MKPWATTSAQRPGSGHASGERVIPRQRGKLIANTVLSIGSD